jgi:hypothetical protein
MLDRRSLGASAAELDSSRSAAVPDSTGCVDVDGDGSALTGSQVVVSA